MASLLAGSQDHTIPPPPHGNREDRGQGLGPFQGPSTVLCWPWSPQASALTGVVAIYPKDFCVPHFFPILADIGVQKAPLEGFQVPVSLNKGQSRDTHSCSQSGMSTEA